MAEMACAKLRLFKCPVFKCPILGPVFIRAFSGVVGRGRTAFRLPNVTSFKTKVLQMN